MIHFGQIWSKKIKNITVVFILSVNVITFYSNILRLVRNPLWSSLILFGQIWPKKFKNNAVIFILSVNVTTFYCNIFRLVRNPIWSNLIHFGQIWSKKIKNKTAIFILSVNVTTFYSNIFRLVRKSNLIKFDPFWTGLIQKKSKIKRPFLSFLKMWQLCILTFFWYVQTLKVNRRRKKQTETAQTAKLKS